MSEVEVIRIAGEVFAIVTACAGFAWYIVRQIWRVLSAVETLTSETTALKEHQATVNGKVGDHIKADEMQFRQINEHLANIEGRMGQQHYEGAHR